MTEPAVVRMFQRVTDAGLDFGRAYTIATDAVQEFARTAEDLRERLRARRLRARPSRGKRKAVRRQKAAARRRG